MYNGEGAGLVAGNWQLVALAVASACLVTAHVSATSHESRGKWGWLQHDSSRREQLLCISPRTRNRFHPYTNNSSESVTIGVFVCVKRTEPCVISARSRGTCCLHR
jgi:hypothetical protein